jgi:hypothetical protein
LPCTKRQLSAARNKQLGWVVGGLFEGKPVSYHVQYILINPETYLMKVNPETYLMKVNPETYLMKVNPETYLMKVNPERCSAH